MMLENVFVSESKDGLWPYHPERAPSRLILEAKQGRAWLVLGWEKARMVLRYCMAEKNTTL